MATHLMTDPQAPYGTPAADDLTARVADLVALLREAEARARARQADVLNELRRPDDAYLARPTRLGMAGRANRTLTQLRR